MSENIDEATPVSPSPSAPMPGVTVAPASSVEPVSAPVDPTMAALFDIARARSSASVAPHLVPVSTPSGFFTGAVRRSIGMARNEPKDVVVAPAELSDRFLTSIVKHADWGKFGRMGFTGDDRRESQRSEIVSIRQVAETVGASAVVV